jgi:prepilin-type N-terminal cleavage/methylation domain-containing protein
MKRTAFTLIELSIVILLLGVAAAAVTLRMQGPMRRAQAGDAAAALADYDRTTRVAARQQDRPLQLAMKLGEGKAWRKNAAGDDLPMPPLTLGPYARVQCVVIGQQVYRAGDAVLPCSRRGCTPSYAVELAGGEASQWFVVAGLTGQMVQVNDEKEALATIAATRGNNAR